MTPDCNYGDSNANVSPESQAIHIETERIKLQARIEALEADLKLIQAGKDAAERSLRYERERALELAQNSNFSLKRDWVALVSELRFLQGKEISEDPKDNAEYQEAMVIDFCNRLRIGALAELTAKSDEELYVIAKSYEVWYKACSAVLQNRALSVKLDRSIEFEKTKSDLKTRDRETKRAKAQDKEDRRRRTPDEIILDSLMKLNMNEEQARAHMAQMKGAAASILGKNVQ